MLQKYFDFQQFIDGRRSVSENLARYLSEKFKRKYVLDNYKHIDIQTIIIHHNKHVTK